MERLIAASARGLSGADYTEQQIEAARIRAFFVHPDWTRRGIGRRLLDYCEAEARAHGFTAIELMATLPGLRLYRAQWALSGNQFVMWRNPSVDPPLPAAGESSYLATVRPLAQQLDRLQVRIVYFQQWASAGHIDAVDVSDIAALYDEPSMARDAIRQAPASEWLSGYGEKLITVFEESVSAADLLMRARLTEIPDARFDFLDESAARVAQSNRLQGEANTAYSLALPVAVGKSEP